MKIALVPKANAAIVKEDIPLDNSKSPQDDRSRLRYHHVSRRIAARSESKANRLVCCRFRMFMNELHKLSDILRRRFRKNSVT